jgi:serine protease inhibitor
MRQAVSRSTSAMLASLLFAVSSCRPETAVEPVAAVHVDPAPLRAVGEVDRRVAAGANGFGFDLLRRLSADSKGTNVVVSPLSIALALGMTLPGASDAVAAEMRKVLGLGDLDADASSAAYGNVMRTLLAADPATTLRIANSIWYRAGFVPRQAFLEGNARHFQAGIRALDFSARDAAAAMNRWVEQATGGKIPSIVREPIDPFVVMVLIDAVYFKGNWTDRFAPSRTKDDVFTRADGIRASCRMMSRDGEMPYAETDEWQAVRLPYGKGAFRMTVVLPKPGVALDSDLAKLDAASWNALRHRLVPREGSLELPRFTTRYRETLVDALRDLGMPAAFHGEALPRIGPRCFVSDVQHATFVEVDESGTEAAAATSVEVLGYTAPRERFRMRVDRPFLFVVDEASTGAILFAGRIDDPSLEGGVK